MVVYKKEKIIPKNLVIYKNSELAKKKLQSTPHEYAALKNMTTKNTVRSGLTSLNLDGI